MSRRKIIRSIEEEEKYQCNKRKKRAEQQAKGREKKRISKKNEIIYSVNEIDITQASTSQANPSTITNVINVIKNNNEVSAINDGIELFNINENINITRNVYNLNIETPLNSNAISSIPSTSNILINDNRIENCINSHKVPLQNIIIDNRVEKSKPMSTNVINVNKTVGMKKIEL